MRHGQSTANAGGVWQGQLDFPLSEAGREQARRAGRALAGEEISGAYSSPLIRAFETASIIARGAGISGEVVPVSGLMERRGGILEGTTREERAAHDPEMVEKLEALPEEEVWAVVGAEADEDVLIRFAEALASIRDRQAPGDRILIVTHGGVMRAFLRDVFGPEIFTGNHRAPNASITRVAWDSGGEEHRLLEIASAQHLL